MKPLYLSLMQDIDDIRFKRLGWEPLGDIQELFETALRAKLQLGLILDFFFPSKLTFCDLQKLITTIINYLLRHESLLHFCLQKRSGLSGFVVAGAFVLSWWVLVN